MYWLQVLWAVVRGLAAGISACYWDDFVASQQGKKKGPSTEQPGPVAPSEPAAGVRVDTGRKEGEFVAGIPYMGSADPRLRPTQAAAPPREGESRRKRRSQPAAPTPAEQLCARCKLALEHELTTAVPADLAVTQEAADLPPSAPIPQAATTRTEDTATSLATPPVEPTAPTSPASASKANGEVRWERPPLLDRLVTRLSTRGALTRLVESAGAVPSGA